MIKTLTIGAFIFVSALTMNASAQEKTSIEVKKEAIIQEENGEMKLIIRTSTGTMSSDEVYTGEEAKAKLAEFENGSTSEVVTSNEISEEISIKEVDGQRELRIKTIDGDVVKEEVYIGAEAEAKIKELEQTRTFKATETKVEKRKISDAFE